MKLKVGDKVRCTKPCICGCDLKEIGIYIIEKIFDKTDEEQRFFLSKNGKMMLSEENKEIHFKILKNDSIYSYNLIPYEEKQLELEF